MLLDIFYSLKKLLKKSQNISKYFFKKQ